MEQINDAIAQNLKLIREQRKMSLDMLAKATGVSKSMLAQIERGEANPTISTVWKIANGLKLSFTQLLSAREQSSEAIDFASVPLLSEEGGRYRNYPIFPYTDARGFEVYYIELDPGVFLEAAAHPEGTQEFLTVFEGELEVSVGGARLHGTPTCALRFAADCPHSYHNAGDTLCRLSMTIGYAGN